MTTTPGSGDSTRGAPVSGDTSATPLATDPLTVQPGAPIDEPPHEPAMVSAQTAAEPGAQAPASHQPPSDPDELRQEIRRTRHELGDTVEAIVHKADVKAQTRMKFEEVKQRVQTQARDQVKATARVLAGPPGQPLQRRPAVAIGAGAATFALLVATFRALRRRRRR